MEVALKFGTVLIPMRDAWQLMIVSPEKGGKSDFWSVIPYSQ